MDGHAPPYLRPGVLPVPNHIFDPYLRNGCIDIFLYIHGFLLPIHRAHLTPRTLAPQRLNIAAKGCYQRFCASHALPNAPRIIEIHRELEKNEQLVETHCQALRWRQVPEVP